MKIIEYLKSDKKRAGLIISILIIISGVIPLLIFTFYADVENPYTIEQKTLVSSDGTHIEAVVYTPKEVSKKHPGIVVGHGYCGNKQYMQPLCIELVKRGFTVVSIDFRGHGSSEGHMPSRGQKFRYNKLAEDMEAGINYLIGTGKINKIGLVGHSMGGHTALEVAEDHPNKVDATVCIGSASTDHDFSRISNLLIAIGQYEQVITKQDAVRVVKKYTGIGDIEIGKRYGHFNDRDACKLFIGPMSEHLGEVHDVTIAHETVVWFENAFNGEVEESIIITMMYHQIFYWITMFGVIAFLFIGIVYMKDYLFKNKFVYTEKEIMEGVSMKRLLIYYFIGNAAVFLFYSDLSFLFTNAVPISSIESLLALSLAVTLSIIVIYLLFLLRHKEGLSLKDLKSKFIQICSPNIKHSIIYGILVALLFIIAISSIAHWSSTTTFPTLRETGAIIWIALLFFPYILTKEFYFRAVQGRLKTSNRFKEYFEMTGLGFLMDNLFLIPVMILFWGNEDGSLAFTFSLSLTALVLILMIQQTLVTWVYMYSGRNIFGSAIFLSIFYAWMIINFFPFAG